VLASSRSQGDMVDFGETGKQSRSRTSSISIPPAGTWRCSRSARKATKIHAPALRRRRLHGDRQFVALPDGPGRAADRARGESPRRSTAIKKNIIANPNCSTAQMVVALKPLHDAAKIKRVVVATYQSVSGAGKAGMDELFEQSRNIFVGDPAEPKKFTKQIAFNVIPHIDSFLDDGSTKEEWKMVVETKKILDPKIKVTATCVRVPVFVGHSEAINIEFEDEISAAQAQEDPARGAGRDADR
jgi:aspartate-semialdehyde dehydrogenase